MWDMPAAAATSSDFVHGKAVENRKSMYWPYIFLLLGSNGKISASRERFPPRPSLKMQQMSGCR